MRRIILIFAIILFGCDDRFSDEIGCGKEFEPEMQLNPEIPDNFNLIVSTVDENGEPFHASSLYWDYVGSSGPKKYELDCQYQTCSQWEFGFEVEGNISIRAEGISSWGTCCTDHYEGITELAVNQSEKQHISLQVEYYATSCA